MIFYYKFFYFYSFLYFNILPCIFFGDFDSWLNVLTFIFLVKDFLFYLQAIVDLSSSLKLFFLHHQLIFSKFEPIIIGALVLIYLLIMYFIILDTKSFMNSPLNSSEEFIYYELVSHFKLIVLIFAFEGNQHSILEPTYCFKNVYIVNE